MCKQPQFYEILEVSAMLLRICQEILEPEEHDIAAMVGYAARDLETKLQAHERTAKPAQGGRPRARRPSLGQEGSDSRAVRFADSAGLRPDEPQDHVAVALTGLPHSRQAVDRGCPKPNQALALLVRPSQGTGTRSRGS